MTVKEMKTVDIRTVDPDTLVDINDVYVDMSLPREERAKEFVRQIKNPYCYKDGKMIVKISFADTDVTLEERLLHYIETR